MTNIVDDLKALATAKEAEGALMVADILHNAVEEIERLRSVLYKIGFDYVELSHEKAQHKYIEHMQMARKAYKESFPDVVVVTNPKPIDDNF